MEWCIASRLPIVMPGPPAALVLGVAAICPSQQLPCLPGAGCVAIIHGMTSAKHQGLIADRSAGARSHVVCRSVQP